MSTQLIKKAEKLDRDTEELSIDQAVEEFPNLLPILSNYNPRIKSILKLSRESLVELSNKIVKLATNVSANAPMLCAGSQCMLAQKCPLILVAGDSSAAPVGTNCPIEELLMENWRRAYKDEFSDQELSKIDSDLIDELVELDIMKQRVDGVLSVKGLLIQNAVGIQQTANGPVPILKQELNPLNDLKDKIAKRKDKLLEQMIATRYHKRTINKQEQSKTPLDVFKIIKDKEEVKASKEVDGK